MRHPQNALLRRLGRLIPALILAAASAASSWAIAQAPTPQGTPPAADANCTVTAMNRTAPLQSDYSFTIYNIPGAGAFFGALSQATPAPPFRVRAVCSDGTVGETDMAFPEFGSEVVYTGEIFWRPATPIPLALSVAAAQSKLSANQATQLTATGVLGNASTVDLTPRSKGTQYTSSNPLIATVNEAGLATVMAQFASGSAARVVMSAQNEGVAGSTVLEIGPRGRLVGKVYRADGTTPVAGAQVTVIRNQPRESLGTVTTDGGGNYALEDVSAGSFSVSVIEPATGDLGRGDGALQTEGETGTVDVRLNGQGTVNVTVLDGAGNPVPNASVTFTSLTGFRDIRTLQTNASGQVVMERALAGQFTVSTRDTASNLVGTAVGTLLVGGSVNIVLKLQPVGSIAGTVYAADAATVQSGTQVRLVSAVRGIITQTVTGEDGRFQFDALPLSDGPYTLDAMQGGRLRARVPNLMLTQPAQQLVQNIVFGPAGMITGTVRRSDGALVEGVTVAVQSLVGQRFSFSTKSNAQGRYVIDGVPVGAFGLTAASASGEVASAGGSVGSDGDVVTLDLQLASNGLVGTVFARDGKTPVPAGVVVTLNSGGMTTQTNAQGQYGFSVSQTGSYTIEASDANGNRGQASIVLTSIVPGDAKRLDVVFLARGSVQGVVRDPSGVAQPGLPVTLTSSSLFGGSATTSADSQGRYRFDDVFIGEFSVYARHATTNLAGFGRGRLAEEGSLVNADVTLAATGSVAGKVVRSDNATAVPGAFVELTVGGAAGLRTTADAQGNFSFPAVPLGDISVLATNPVDGDMGQVVSRLVTLNEARTVRIRLLGQGAVRVRAVNGANQPVEGAAVTVTSASQFGGTLSGVTNAEGIAMFSPVFNGDVRASAEKGVGAARLSDSGLATIIDGRTAELTLTLAARPVGSIAGAVTKGVSANPQAGVTVRLVGANGDERSMVTQADGRYAFEAVEVGRDYRLTALIDERVRARADVTLSSAGEQASRNLVLLGVGTVNGRATTADKQPQPGVLVTLSNPDPVYGGEWTLTSQADGSYRFDGISAGNFTLRARSNDGRLQGQSSGMVRFDADVATVDLTLVDSAANLPVTLYDANGNGFDLQGDGSIGTGTAGVFAGNGGADVRASRLEIVVNGVAVPFQNGDGTIGSLTQLGQLLEVDDFHAASGLDVARRIYVPKNGYFSRTLEVLENRTANPVTVGVRVVSNIAPGVAGARVVETSSSDSVLDVTAEASRDRWVILDDDRDADPFKVANNPSVAMVFDGTSAAARVGSAAVTAVGAVAKAAWQWDGVTIAPGASVAFLHFTSQQLGRIPAREAAGRLEQLPPEALEGLTAGERAIIQNFRVPADGLSTLVPLPSVENSVVSGTVYAGDGATPIPNAAVELRSKNALFGRTYRGVADAEGRFNFSSRDFGQAQVVAIAQDAFTASAVHPQTDASTAPGAGVFSAGQPAVRHDLIFVGTGNLVGTVKRHTGALVTNGYVSIPYPRPGQSVPGDLSALINADGTYKFTGIVPRDYLVTATEPHPQGRPLNGSVPGMAAVVPASTTVVAVTMEETGEITGTVRAANGEPVVGARMELDPNPIFGRYRQTQTDTGGNFRFTDVAVGSRVVKATGDTGLQESVSTTVVKDTAAVVNLQLAGTGQILVQVNYQRGEAAVGAQVVLVNRGWAATNGAGQVSFSGPADVPLTVRAYHPDNAALVVEGAATIRGNGSTANLTLNLPAAGSIVGVLLRPDGVTPAADVPVVVRLQDGTADNWSAWTDAAGAWRVNGLPVGPYTVSAEDRPTFKFASADASVGADGQEVTVDMQLADNRIALPADLRDANDFLFDIQSDGSIGKGWRRAWSMPVPVYENGGSLLEINGETFVGEASAYLEAGRRQFAISQPTSLAGLQVTRKVFVPRGGYFARYLEVLENPAATPITVAVRVMNTFRQDFDTSIYATSSGDAQLQATGTQRDTWVVMDDAEDRDPFVSYSPPATALVLGPGNSGAPHDLLVFNTSNGVALEAGWSAVTVPANGRVVLMHFQVQQVSRAGARAAAERLQQMPPEALDGLSAEERAAIANFTLPANGQSTVAPLPSLLGRVSGVVQEGDGRRVVPNAEMELRSSHPLFGRTRVREGGEGACHSAPLASLLTDASGVFSLQGSLQDEDSVALPVGFDVAVKARETRCSAWSRVGHPVTGIPSSTFMASFTQGSTQTVQNVVFDSGILTGTVVGPMDYSVGGGAVQIDLPPNTNSSWVKKVGVTIANDGSYVFPGLPPGRHDIAVRVWHNQGTNLEGSRPGALVTRGETTVTDINVEPTGSLNGVVITANGEAMEGGWIEASLNGGARGVVRSTMTDSLGRYSFTALPVGEYTLAVTDFRTGAITRAIVTVNQNQQSTRNVTLIGAGVVRLTVNYARGTPAAEVDVYLRSAAAGNSFEIKGRTDSQGKLNVLVPVGDYTLRVSHPLDGYSSDRWVELSGTIAANNDARDALLTLGARAAIRITLVDQDAGNAPISGVQVSLSDAGRCASTCAIGATNEAGQLLLTDVQGSYRVSVRTLQGRSAQIDGVIEAAADGQTLDRTMSVSTSADTLAVLGFNGERHLYSIPANANDVISIRIVGAAVNGTGSSYVTRAQVHDVNKQRLAEGYGYDGRGDFEQYNQVGDLARVVAPVAGNYTIAISSDYSDVYLGGYRLSVAINGQPVVALPYADGGVVTGVVTDATGSPVAGQPIEIRTSDALELRVRTATEGNGTFRFVGVPVGGFTVTALDAASKAVVNSASGTLGSAGQTVTANLQLPIKTDMQVQVRILGSLPIPGEIYFTVTGSDGRSRQEGPLTFATGESTSSVKTVSFYVERATVEVVHPIKNTIVATATVVGANAQTIPVVLTLAATDVEGTVLNAAGVPAAKVFILAETAAPNRYLGQLFSDAQGRYRFLGLPVGEEIIFWVEDPDTGFWTATRTTLLAQSGTQTLNLQMSGKGSVTGKITTASGVPLQGQWVYASYDSSRLSAITDSAGVYTFESIPLGRVISVKASVDTLFGPVSEQLQLTLSSNGERAVAPDMVFKLGGVRGTVSFADGTLSTRDTSFTLTSNGKTHILPGTRINSGPVWFAAYGVGAGPFTVRAEDWESRLQTTVSGNLIDANELLTLNLILPSSGVVTGVLRDKNNAPVRDATVYVRSSANDAARYATTDQNGMYRLERVALGTITVAARTHGSAPLVAVATGQLATADAVLNVDLQAESTVPVSGRVLSSSGAPVANATVRISTVRTYGDFGSILFETETDGNGSYSFPGIPVGELHVLGWNNASGLAGEARGTAVENTPLQLDVTLGGSAFLPSVFAGPDGSRYDVDRDGTLIDGGFGNADDAYDGAYELFVDGNRLPSTDIAKLINGDREIVLGPHAIANLQVTRYVYVPVSGGYARYLERLTNPGSAAVTVPVEARGNLGSDEETRLIVSPAQSGGRYAVTNDGGTDPALAHVFASTGAALVGTQSFSEGDDEFMFGWNVTVPAGATVTLMHFAVQRAPGDASGAQAQAEALSTMTQPGMFEGLSSADRETIKNFTVSP